MSELGGTCGNCGAEPSVVRCVDVWREPHTHPKAYNDPTPIPCTLLLCRKCECRVTRNLRDRPGRQP